MAKIRDISRDTRRGLFGAALPRGSARAWDATLMRFQGARDKLGECVLCLNQPGAQNGTLSLSDEISAHISRMDETARALTAASAIANGIGSLPGFAGVSALGLFDAGEYSLPVSMSVLNSLAERAEGLVTRVGGLAGYTPFGNFGGDIWELLHPGQVQDEYEAVGKEAPSKIEIMTGAAADATERAKEGAVAGLKLTRNIVIGAAIVTALAFIVPKLKELAK